MMYLYTGTDREKAREKMSKDIARAAKGAEVIRINDTHSLGDLNAAFQGGGMFASKRVLVFENICAVVELRDRLLEKLPEAAKGEDDIYIYEEKPLADLRKKLEKHAETSEKFDAPKKERDSSIFAMANAMRAGDKKALWVAYMRELAKGSAPEAIHGVLFWGAKDMFMKGGGERAKSFVATLAELPHAARRRGEDLEYALERFVLSAK